MINKKYKAFMKEFEAKKYVSATSEFKRTTHQKVERNINVKEDVLFAEIMRNILKGSNMKSTDLDNFFEGDLIKTKEGEAFIKEYKKNEIITYISKGKNDKGVTFNTTGYKITPTKRDYSILKFSFASKLPGTVTGMNGLLGNLKFKKETKKHGNAVIDFLKKKLEVEV